MDKKFLVIGVVIVVLLVAGGGFFIMSSGKKAAPQPTVTQDQTVQDLSPKDIGLQLVMSYGNKRVKVVVGKASDIKNLEYDITYSADVPASELAPGEEAVKVERGFNDQATIKQGSAKYESKEFDLGSCSKSVCRYDTGVDSVSILMKVVKRDGKIYQVKDSIKF